MIRVPKCMRVLSLYAYQHVDCHQPAPARGLSRFYRQRDTLLEMLAGMKVTHPLAANSTSTLTSHSDQRQLPDDPILPTASDLYVRSLPGLPPTSRLSLYAGNLPSTPPSASSATADSSDAHLYFLLAANKHIPNRHRLLIWLNGGPGCSSFDGA